MLGLRKRESNKFIAGERIKIRSKDEIGKTVDAQGTQDGCLFMETMFQYCGNTYRILKVVDNIFDGHNKRTLKTRSALYILDGLTCDGKMNQFLHKCDRSCFLLWHEDWLETTQQSPFTNSKLDFTTLKERRLVDKEMCQLQLIQKIGCRNSSLNDKLQYSIRKIRWYRKNVSYVIHKLLNLTKATDLNQDKIQPGDLVKVRQKADIKLTLNDWRQTKGLTFLTPMYKESGKKFRVFKKVEYLFDESKQRMVKCKGIVLLEGCFCNGETAYLKTCDRTCFYFWQEDWLEKITD